MAQNKKVFKTEYRYKLEPYSGRKTRHDCPSCRGKKTFTRYIDITDGTYLSDDVGKCDRIVKCGFHNPPIGNMFKDKSLVVNSNKIDKRFLKPNYTNLIDSKYVNKTTTYEDNFSKFLLDNFNPLKVFKTLNKYKVGQVDLWQGATVFWQIDRNYDVRTGKVMLYDNNCSRVKKPYNHISWIHSPLSKNEYGANQDYCLTQCFFGEHLLNEEPEVVRIVESEKTAIICNLVNEDTWIATGGIELINFSRLLPFKRTKMIFYPDKGEAVELWKKKLSKFSDFNIEVDESINKFTMLKDGEDMADFILYKQKSDKKW